MMSVNSRRPSVHNKAPGDATVLKLFFMITSFFSS